MSERDMLYDEMCNLLTEYEENKERDDNDYVDYADRFYLFCVKVQNKWETVITAQ